MAVTAVFGGKKIVANPFEDSPEYDDEGEWDGGTELGETAHIQINLLRERSKLAQAERQKYESRRLCLEAEKSLIEAKRDLAKEERARAEADRDRSREARLALRDQRRLLLLRKEVQEEKQRTLIVGRQYVQELRECQAQAHSLEERLIYEKHGVQLDPQTAECIACPKCGERMGYDEPHGRICPDCRYPFV